MPDPFQAVYQDRRRGRPDTTEMPAGDNDIDAMRAMNPRSTAGLTVQRTVLRARGADLAHDRPDLSGATRPPSDAIELPDYPQPAVRAVSV